jgi:hypothetical protein
MVKGEALLFLAGHFFSTIIRDKFILIKLLPGYAITQRKQCPNQSVLFPQGAFFIRA